MPNSRHLILYAASIGALALVGCDHSQSKHRTPDISTASAETIVDTEVKLIQGFWEQTAEDEQSRYDQQAEPSAVPLTVVHGMRLTIANDVIQLQAPRYVPEADPVSDSPSPKVANPFRLTKDSDGQYVIVISAGGKDMNIRYARAGDRMTVFTDGQRITLNRRGQSP